MSTALTERSWLFLMMARSFGRRLENNGLVLNFYKGAYWAHEYWMRACRWMSGRSLDNI